MQAQLRVQYTDQEKDDLFAKLQKALSQGMDKFNDDCLVEGVFQQQKNQFIDSTVNYIKDWERMHSLKVDEGVFKQLHTFTSDLLQQIALEELEVQEEDTDP